MDAYKLPLKTAEWFRPRIDYILLKAIRCGVTTPPGTQKKHSLGFSGERGSKEVPKTRGMCCMRKPKSFVTTVRGFHIVSPNTPRPIPQPLMAAPPTFTTSLHAFFKRKAMFLATVCAFWVLQTRRTR